MPHCALASGADEAPCSSEVSDPEPETAASRREGAILPPGFGRGHLSSVAFRAEVRQLIVSGLVLWNKAAHLKAVRRREEGRGGKGRGGMR